MDAIKKLVDDDTSEFSKSLEHAGGVISLVRIGIELYRGIQDKLETDEQKAFGALLKMSFESANETLDDINTKHFKGSELEGLGRDFKRNIMKTLLDSFAKSSDWNSYLPEHPSIIEFRRTIMHYLKERDVDSERINDFVLQFNLRIEDKADNSEDFKKFYKWWTLEKQQRALKKYLEYVKNKMYYLKGLDKKPLHEYYVWHNAIRANTDSWNWDEEQLYKDQKYKNEVHDIRQLVRDFLLSGEEDWYLVVGAPFGIGKTSMVRMIASLYASSYLNRTEDVEKEIAILNVGPDKRYFIPVLAFLKSGLNNVHGRKDVEDVLLDTASSLEERNQQAQQRPILLILDGLDEYGEDDKVRDLMDSTLKEKHRKYQNMKVIITTRLKAGVPELLHITNNDIESDTNNTYVRLLSFTENQVDEFFTKYDAPLTYNTVSKFGLHREEITKPLFTWMLSLIYTDPQYKIDFPKNWSSRMLKSFIYMLFFHYVIQGKHRQTIQTEKWNESYINEKRVLRHIAAVKQAGSGDLTLEQIEKLAKSDSANSYLEPIITSYFYLRTDTVRGRVVDFVHETFKEYLLAEYYIESLLENRPYKLNIEGVPSRETIEFLYGLLDLLKSSEKRGEKNNDGIYSKSVNIERYLISDDTSLLGSFKKRNKIDEVIEQIISSARWYLESDDIFFPESKDIVEVDEKWKKVQVNGDYFKNLWIYKWMSLSIINTLEYSKTVDKEKLINIIINSANEIPYPLKVLKQTDLTRAKLQAADLSGADLSGADLSGADLTHALLFYTNLTGANLTGAKLRGAIFFGSDLTGANLSGADLTGADLSSYKHLLIVSFLTDLSKANLSGADLSRANLSGSDLTRSHLSGANLSGADLTRSHLSGANLSGADLTRARLSEANTSGFPFAVSRGSSHYSSFIDRLWRTQQSGADLTGANLSGADLTRARLSEANLSRANLSRADLSKVDLANSIMIGIQSYTGIQCEQANFEGTLIDNKGLIHYLNINGAKALPEAIHDREELRKRIEDKHRYLTKEQIEILLQHSLMD